MPNKSISQLTAGGAVSAADIFPAVQTANVGPVKVTAAQIATYTGTAVMGGSVLAAGYIPYGNGTSAFGSSSGFVIDGNTNLGLGTSSPSTTLGKNITLNGVAVGSNAGIVIQSASVERGYFYGNDTNFVFGSSTNIPLLFLTNSSERLRITSTGTVNIVGAGTAGSSQTVSFNGSAPINSMVLDASGNLGLGVTPSAWSGMTVAQVTTRAFFGGNGNVFDTGNNCYKNSSGNWIALGTAGASLYEMYDGVHMWFVNAAGANNRTIAFDQAMTLDSSGRLGVGVTGTSARLASAAADGTFLLALIGTSKAIRVSTSSDASIIDGVDNTLTGSYQPLIVNGSYLALSSGGTERARITANGNIEIKNSVSVPSSNPSGGGVLYVEGGALKYRGSSGTVTTIANA